MKDNNEKLIAVLCAAIILLVSALFIGMNQLKEETRRLMEQAVDLGYAEWTVSKSGDVTWYWRENKK